MSQIFEIVIFTAAMKEYADVILDIIDKKRISHRLYRHHVSKINSFQYKDLNLLGRDLKKLIIVDNLEENFALQKDNGIKISPYYGCEKDEELMKLNHELKLIVKENPEDIRIKLEKVREKLSEKILENL